MSDKDKKQESDPLQVQKADQTTQKQIVVTPDVAKIIETLTKANPDQIKAVSDALLAQSSPSSNSSTSSNSSSSSSSSAFSSSSTGSQSNEAFQSGMPSFVSVPFLQPNFNPMMASSTMSSSSTTDQLLHAVLSKLNADEKERKENRKRKFDDDLSLFVCDGCTTCDRLTSEQKNTTPCVGCSKEHTIKRCWFAHSSKAVVRRWFQDGSRLTNEMRRKKADRVQENLESIISRNRSNSYNNNSYNNNSTNNSQQQWSTSPYSPFPQQLNPQFQHMANFPQQYYQMPMVGFNGGHLQGGTPTSCKEVLLASALVVAVLVVAWVSAVRWCAFLAEAPATRLRNVQTNPR
jgi:hypothetical protein